MIALFFFFLSFLFFFGLKLILSNLDARINNLAGTLNINIVSLGSLCANQILFFIAAFVY